MALLTLVVVMALAGAMSARVMAQPQPPKDFVPVVAAPGGEQIPAMPLLGIAYGFIWVGVFGYVWSLGRRLQQVDSEISELERRRK